MSKFEKDLERLKTLRAALLGATALTVAFAGTAFAQDDASDDDGVTVIEETEEEAESSGDTVVVTGSRVKRDTYSSIAPLQVITTDVSKDIGLIDPTTILQESTAAAGTQIDTTFQGFVLDNGPGSTTLNLRGLGASRTLLLINGRRMAPGGVEGAPTQPSLNLLPGSLIERYDLLLDGASSVYGSDAVAGVGNVVLRKDFEGLELYAQGDYAEQGAGNDYTFSGTWGRNSDRGFFGIGAEYDYRDEVTFADRDFLAGCRTNYEITETGEIRTVDVATNAQSLSDTQGLVGARQSPCVVGAGGFTDRLFERASTSFGSAYYTPGTGNLLADYSDTGLFRVPIDRDGDGIADIYFADFSPGSRDLEQSLYSEQKRTSIMAFGEYTLEGNMNLTPYFEVLYTNLDVNSNSGVGVVFPDVPANNQFNPCNPAAPGGVDCGLAEDNLLLSPEYLAAFTAYWANPLRDLPEPDRPGRLGNGGDNDCFGFGAALCPAVVNAFFTNGPLGAIPVSGQVSVRGDRNLTDVTLQQTRVVAGVGGDLPFINFGPVTGWTFDASASYSRSEGTSSRPGIRDDRLALALGYDPSTDLNGDGIIDGDTINATGVLSLLPGGPCDVANIANPGLLAADVTAGCVPVNMFAPSLYAGVAGDFATQAERDYLFDTRDFDTVYEQTLFNAYATGKLFDLPAGAISGVIGAEYRIDSIDSIPDEVARDGLFFGFFVDQGAVGEKWTREAFFELDVPLLANNPIAQSLEANFSGRWTEDEFYGSAWTYSAKVGWRPIDPLLIKASVGTSFKAPNLRENFLLGQSGFGSVFDPCAVPDELVDPLGGIDPLANDPRDPATLANCVREGRDPFAVGFDATNNVAFQSTGVEVTTGGVTDIIEETSDSFTAGIAFEQPWFDNFDMTLNIGYYDIEVENTIIEPSSGFIVNDCFTRQDGVRSPFCDRISYDGAGGFFMISDIDAGFINQDKETVAGIDYNISFFKEMELFGKPVDLNINLRANQLKERATIFVNDDLSVAKSTFNGQFGFPEWTASNIVSLDVDDYRFTWSTRFIGDVEQNPAGIDPFSDAIDTLRTGFVGDTCLGPVAGDVRCRDVGFADGWAEHAASIRYTGDTWIIRAGITNIFNNKPPLVDGSEVFSVSNTPIGNGYDLDGRQYFFSLTKDFN
jgi:iron complex outermembrane recepter protein